MWYQAHRYLRCHWLLTTSVPSLPYTSLFIWKQHCVFVVSLVHISEHEGFCTSHGNLCRKHNRIKLTFLYHFVKMQSPIFICVSYINGKQARFKTKKPIVLKLPNKIVLAYIKQTSLNE